MSNEITGHASTGLAALANLRKGLAQVRQTMPASVGGQPLLRLQKNGDWVVGSEDTLLAAGTEGLLNPLSVMAGYSCWTNRAAGMGKNELMGEELWGIMSGKPPVSAMPVHHDPRTQDLCAWKDAMSADIRIIDGPLKGQQLLYKTTSVGGLRVMQALLDAMIQKLDTGSEYCCPVVTLASDSYRHASYGLTFVPKIDIVGWATMEGVEEEDDGAPAPVDKQIAKATPEPKPEPKPEADAAPAGRRRRI